MSIIYYTTRPQRAVAPAIDRVMAKTKILLANGNQALYDNPLDEVINYPADWKINNIMLQFTSAETTPKTYSVSIKNGRAVVTEMNDYLWFQTSTSAPTKITLSAGFYDGDQLATQLKTKLDLAFAPLTFTVNYNSTNINKYTITPSSGTIRYIDYNFTAGLTIKQSIAGHLFGYMATSTYQAALVSDTAVPALTMEIPLFSATDTTDTTILNNDGFTLDMDQALHLTVDGIEANSDQSDSDSAIGDLSVAWSVGYHEIVK